MENLLFPLDLPMGLEPGRAALLRRPSIRDNGGAATPPYQEEVHGERGLRKAMAQNSFIRA
jgi:hypothetical protein